MAPTKDFELGTEQRIEDEGAVSDGVEHLEDMVFSHRVCAGVTLDGDYTTLREMASGIVGGLRLVR